MAESNGHDGGEWITLAEAAERSGISIDALRRRLKRGTLAARREQTRYGPTWLVDAGALPSASARVDATPRVDATVGGGTDFLLLIGKLHEEAAVARETAAMWQARAEFLAGQLADAQRALEAPKSETVPEPTPTTEATSRPPTSLWARLTGWFGG